MLLLALSMGVALGGAEGTLMQEIEPGVLRRQSLLSRPLSTLLPLVLFLLL